MYSSISSLLYRSICIIFNFGKSVMTDSFYSMYVTWRVVVELAIGDQVFVLFLALQSIIGLIQHESFPNLPRNISLHAGSRDNCGSWYRCS